jgi:hypothetical protein
VPGRELPVEQLTERDDGADELSHSPGGRELLQRSPLLIGDAVDELLQEVLSRVGALASDLA